MYAVVDVIVDGALEESSTFHDETLMSEYIKNVEEDAGGHGYPTRVYVQYHDHDDMPCECHQYTLDVRPDYSWNEKDD